MLFTLLHPMPVNSSYQFVDKISEQRVNHLTSCVPCIKCDDGNKWMKRSNAGWGKKRSNETKTNKINAIHFNDFQWFVCRKSSSVLWANSNCYLFISILMVDRISVKIACQAQRPRFQRRDNTLWIKIMLNGCYYHYYH